MSQGSVHRRLCCIVGDRKFGDHRQRLGIAVDTDASVEVRRSTVADNGEAPRTPTSLTVTVSSPCDVLSESGGIVGAYVGDRGALDLAIDCFNVQTPAGDYQLSLLSSINYASGQVVRTIDQGGSATITISGAGRSLIGQGLFINAGDVTVTNTRITGGSAGISASGGSVTVQESLIDDVSTGVTQNGGAVTL